VEQNDAVGRQLRFPRLPIVVDGLVRMQPVDVQQGDRSVRHVARRLVEGGLDESGESSVSRVVAKAQLGKHLVAEEAGMLISAPRVHAIAGCLETQLRDRLAKGEVRIAGVDTQLDEHLRADHLDNRHREGNVLLPGDRVDVARKLQAERVVERVERHRRHPSAIEEVVGELCSTEIPSSLRICVRAPMRRELPEAPPYDTSAPPRHA